MGFTFNNIHSDTLNICVRTESIPCIAPRRNTAVTVPGRDGQYMFEEGYDNVKVKFNCNIVDSATLNRRVLSRQIAAWLAYTGILILDQDPTIRYKVVKTSSGIDSLPVGYELPVDDFAIEFECSPHKESVDRITTEYTYVEELFLKWGEVNLAWSEFNMPWLGYPQHMTVINDGTYKSLPLIKMEGAASYIIFGGLSITGLSGVLYIDCNNQVVYRVSGASKINEMSKFSGYFPVVHPGENTFPIYGNITELNVVVEHHNTYL